MGVVHNLASSGLLAQAQLLSPTPGFLNGNTGLRIWIGEMKLILLMRE